MNLIVTKLSLISAQYRAGYIITSRISEVSGGVVGCTGAVGGEGKAAG
jgi:hypothetical protein